MANETMPLDVLFSKVYLPVFVKACADLGIGFESEDELEAALNSVTVIKQAEAQAPAAPVNFHKAANELLMQTVNGESNNGYDINALTNAAVQDADVQTALATMLAQ